MKKLFVIIFAFILLVLLASCNGVKNGANDLSAAPKSDESNIIEIKGGAEPDPTIEVRSLEALEEMRKMAETEDEEVLTAYLRRVRGGGARSREDLIDFLELIDSLPVIKFIDGEITWISHNEGYARDAEGNSTGDYYNVVFVSTEAKNGDKTRVEYLLSVSDVSAEIEKRKSDSEFINSVLENPIKSKNEKIKLYCEARKKNVSENVNFINWTLDVDGIYTRLVYWPNDIDSVVTTDVFDKISVSSMKEITIE